MNSIGLRRRYAGRRYGAHGRAPSALLLMLLSLYLCAQAPTATAYTAYVSTTVSNQVVSSGRQNVVNGGLTVSTTVIAPGTQAVNSGAATIATTLSGAGMLYGSQTVLSGGVTTGTIAYDHGDEEVFGVASGTIVSSGGTLNVQGGLTISAVISSGGLQLIFAGSVSATSVLSGGLQDIEGGIVSGGTIGEGAEQRIGWSASAAGMTISGAGALQLVSSGGAYSTLVISSGEQDVAYGLASGTEVGDGGSESVRAGGRTISSLVQSGGVESLNGGNASATTVASGGQLLVNSGSSTLTVVSGGNETVSSGGVDTSGTLLSGGVQTLIGGTASATAVDSGGLQIVSSGGVANGSVVSGGEQLISSGGVASASLVLAGGTQTILSAGSATQTIAAHDGVVNVSSGGVASLARVSSGGVVNVSAGGVADMTTVSSGGELNVSSGGVADATTVLGAGLLNVYSGGQTLSSTLDGALDGVENVYSGGVAQAVRVQTGGVLNVLSGGTADAVVDSGGIVNLYQASSVTSARINAGGEAMVQEDGVNTIDQLTLEGGIVTFVSGGTFKTLRVDQLDGHGGTFVMTENVAAEQGDLLVISSGYAGNHQLDIANEGGAHASLSYEHKVVDSAAATQAAGADFTLSHPVEVGPYKYLLKQNADGSWYLYAPPTTSDPDLTSTAVAGVRTFGASFMLGFVENQTLLQRLGDLRLGTTDRGVWMRAYSGKLTTQSGPAALVWNEPYTGVQMGVDAVRGSWVLGGLLGTTQASPDAIDGNATITNYYLGAYATWLGAEQRYVDLVAMTGTSDHGMSITDTAGNGTNGSVTTTYLQASVEAGQRFGPWRDGLYLEPQLQVTTLRQNGGQFTASNGLQVTGDAVASTQGRLGAVFGWTRSEVAHPFNIYLKTSLLHQYGGRFNVDLNGLDLSNDFGGTWLQYGTGFNLQWGNGRDWLYGDVTRTDARGQMQQPWQVNLGLRMAW